MKKKLRVLSVLSVFIAFTLLFSACGSTNNADSTNTSNTAESTSSASGGDPVLKDGKMEQLNIFFPGGNSNPADLADVENSINNIIKDKIDATIKLNISEWGVYSDKLNMLLSSGEDADIVFTWSSSMIPAKNGQVQKITQFIQEYAPEAYSSFERYMDACKVDGEIYGLPTFHEYASQGGLVCRKDIFDQTGIDASTVKSWADIEMVLKKVHESNPRMTLLTNAEQTSGPLQYYNTGVFDIIQTDSQLSVYVNNQDGKIKVVDKFSTPEYREMAEKAFDWNKKGYFIPDATTVTETRQDLIRAGNTFGFIGLIHPGTVKQETANSGKEMIALPVTDGVLNTGGVNFAQYMIPTASKNPEKAVAFLNMLYSNMDVQNLFSYGVEGKDYVIKDKDKGIIGYPDGKNSTSVGWSNETWLTGNASISYIWETQSSSIWQDYLDFNAKAKVSPLYGFVYDPSNVRNEIAATKNVITKYRAVIEAGYYEPNKSVAALNNELKSAGMQKIVDDAQQQVDKWLSSKK